MNEQITLQNDEGQEFTGTEILGISLDRDFKDLEEGTYISVIQGEDQKLYPFVKKDDNTVELIEDDDVLDLIEEMLDLVLTEQDSEANSF